MFRNSLTKVDIFDNELGEITKQEAHSSPVLHRAFSVFLVNDNNEILIQKRAKNKYHSGGLWANACCSHPAPKEDVVLSAQKRLSEELGVSTELKELFSFVYLHKFDDNLFEYEYDHVLLGKYNGQVELNKEEASECLWISPEQLAKALRQTPQKFASWFLICAPKVLSMLKNE